MSDTEQEKMLEIVARIEQGEEVDNETLQKLQIWYTSEVSKLKDEIEIAKLKKDLEV